MSGADRDLGPADGLEARRTRSTGTDAPDGAGGFQDDEYRRGLVGGSPEGPHRSTGTETPAHASGDSGPARSEGGGAAPDMRDGSDVARAGRRSRRGVLLRRLLLIGLLVAGGLALLIAWSLTPVSETSDPVEFEVLPGWGASRVSVALERAGLVRNAELFSGYLRLRGLDRSVGEGIYDLDRAQSAPELAAELVRGGRPRVVQVLLPEGSRASDLSRRLEASGLAEAASYQELIERPGQLRPAHLPEEAGLEGYLFPASYEIPVLDPPTRTLSRLLERFERELADARERLGELGMSVHEWVTLASLVQAEAGNDEEMPLIAGVFLNRLDLGMPLQSDPTVAYGLGKRLPELDALAGDLRKDHPWNTYTRPGLPRGPICNPGRAALQAVLDPVRRDENGREYLYFLHGISDGEPVFRINLGLEGHNRDVARYLRGR